MSKEVDHSLAAYEATVTTGIEWVAKEEVKDKLKIDATTAKGRIFFSTCESVESILKLRSINNLFVLIYDSTVEEHEMPTDSASLETLLMKVGDLCDWKIALEKWMELSLFKCSIDELLTKSTDLREKQPKFRVSCNRFGLEHKFTSPEVCCIFGHVVDTKFGWPIKMKDYDIEILVTFSEQHLYAGLTLTHKALDRRNIISTGLTTLRATTCYALLRIARIQCGDILLDPMAGSGAIPVECCCSFGTEWLPYTIAGELKSIPINKCKANLMMFKDSGIPNNILQLDVTGLPFRTGSIDVLVSDLPFGRRHGSKRLNRTLYPALLREMGRVARVGTARAVLLTQDHKSINYAYSKSRDLWFQKYCTFVKIGNLNCYIYLFMRNNNSFVENKSTPETTD